MSFTSCPKIVDTLIPVQEVGGGEGGEESPHPIFYVAIKPCTHSYSEVFFYRCELGGLKVNITETKVSLWSDEGLSGHFLCCCLVQAPPI